MTASSVPPKSRPIDSPLPIGMDPKETPLEISRTTPLGRVSLWITANQKPLILAIIVIALLALSALAVYFIFSPDQTFKIIGQGTLLLTTPLLLTLGGLALEHLFAKGKMTRSLPPPRLNTPLTDQELREYQAEAESHKKENPRDELGQTYADNLEAFVETALLLAPDSLLREYAENCVIATHEAYHLHRAGDQEGAELAFAAFNRANQCYEAHNGGNRDGELTARKRYHEAASKFKTHLEETSLARAKEEREKRTEMARNTLVWLQEVVYKEEDSEDLIQLAEKSNAYTTMVAVATDMEEDQMRYAYALHEVYYHLFTATKNRDLKGMNILNEALGEEKPFDKEEDKNYAAAGKAIEETLALYQQHVEDRRDMQPEDELPPPRE